MLVVVYFYLLIIPSFAFIAYFTGFIVDLNFYEIYSNFYETLLIEVIAATLVTGLYLTQFEIRATLEQHKLSLEHVVNKRTEELALANKTLSYLNENLDDLVKARSKK